MKILYQITTPLLKSKCNFCVNPLDSSTKCLLSQISCMLISLFLYFTLISLTHRTKYLNSTLHLQRITQTPPITHTYISLVPPLTFFYFPPYQLHFFSTLKSLNFLLNVIPSSLLHSPRSSAASIQYAFFPRVNPLDCFRRTYSSLIS